MWKWSLVTSGMRAAKDPMEVASDHDQGHKRHDTSWKYLPRLLEARPHH
jgi:hypothetical protein